MTSLADYNNNPGNLKPPGGKVDFYKGQIGVDDNGFAVFKNKDSGRKALVQDLEAKIKRGVNTPEKFIDIYSPAGPENYDEEGRDNYKLYLAQQLGLSGTGKPFGKEHIEKLADAVTAFEGGTWTDKKPDGPSAKEPERSPYGSDVVGEKMAPEGSGKQESPYGSDVVGDGVYESDVVRDQSMDADQAARSRKETAALTGLTGAGLGSVYSLKSPAVRLMSRIGLLPGGKPPSPTEAAELVDRIMSREQISPAPSATTPGGKWAAKTGYGMGEGTVQDVSSRYQRAIPSGKVSGPYVKKFGPAMPGEPRDLVERMIQRRAAQEAAQAATEGDVLLRQSLEKSLTPTQDLPQRAAQLVMRSPIVRGGLAGLGIGYNLQGASQELMQPEANALNTAAGATNLTAAGLSALGLIPKIASVANPAAVAATTGAEVMSDLARGNKQAAAESGLTGLTALAPRIFGPLGALFYSRGLSSNEEEDMRRLREQQANNPNFYSGKLKAP
jgi:hypothetical protein